MNKGNPAGTTGLSLHYIVGRLAELGSLPGDSDEERTRKGALVLSTVLITCLAVIWVATYAALGLPRSAAIPFAYQLVSIVSLIVFFKFKRYQLFRTTQLLLTLALPFLLQASLGGFVASSAVSLWAFTAPLGALVFVGTVAATPWFAAFGAGMLFMGLLEHRLSEHAADIPAPLQTTFFVLNLLAVSLVAWLVLIYFVGKRESALRALDREHRRSERLLLNVLPVSIAARLKDGERTIADRFAQATILFADIVDFTPWAGEKSPEVVVGALDAIFTAFDALAEERGLEKIKTIGDAYMVAGGLPDPQTNHIEAIADMAISMMAVAHDTKVGGRAIELRIGIDTGPVVAGVIGKHKFIYDLWGDTVNLASRLESQGLPGRIQVTSRVREALEDRYLFEPRGVIDVKGKGATPTWFLLADGDGFGADDVSL